MNCYLLPSNYINNFYNIIDIKYSFFNEENNNNDNDNIEILVNKTLYDYLKIMKSKINKYSNKWEIYKKYTNPYEYIHTIIPNTKHSVSKLKPISGSYYKFIEIFNTYDILNELNSEKIKTFHLAEGPGGFIEAILSIRNNKNDIYYGMTLQNENNINIPGWKNSSSFLNNNKNVIIESGFDNDGDITSKNNLLYCYSKYKNSIDLITGDGSFDFSVIFNKQETSLFKIILCQFIFAISIQKTGGMFILKVFDLFTKPSIELLYLLTLCYEKVYISKLNTSRISSSEKYIICKNFMLDEINIDILFNKLINAYDYINYNSNIIQLLNINIPYYFISKIEEINAIFGQQQIENISITITLLETNKNDKIENMKKNNISKCILWCQKHKILHNKNIIN